MEIEFEKEKVKHKRRIILETLETFDAEGIYRETPLLRTFAEAGRNEKERAEITEDILYNNYYKSNDPEAIALYNKFYDLCYEMLETYEKIISGENPTEES